MLCGIVGQEGGLQIFEELKGELELQEELWNYRMSQKLYAKRSF